MKGRRRYESIRDEEPERLTLAPGQLAVPNIRLIRKIAEGGMGSVWEGEHLSLRTVVAVKFVLAEHRQNAQTAARFEGEATAAARIRSPHVVQVFDQGITEDGIRYIVMELLEGEDLEARLERNPRLPLEVVAQVVAQAARALTKAHGIGVVHRDIKPSNIFLSGTGDELFVKILDFGIAKVSLADMANLRVTQTGAVIGTPAFMAPEQMTHAKDVGPPADMWSLAVVAFLALTGRLPYESETLAGLAMAIERGVFPDATTLVRDLPPGIDDWFRTALARAPERRFDSVRAMADELLRLADLPAPASSLTSTPPPNPLAAYNDETTEVSAPSLDLRPDDDDDDDGSNDATLAKGSIPPMSTRGVAPTLIDPSEAVTTVPRESAHKTVMGASVAQGETRSSRGWFVIGFAVAALAGAAVYGGIKVNEAAIQDGRVPTSEPTVAAPPPTEDPSEQPAVDPPVPSLVPPSSASSPASASAIPSASAPIQKPTIPVPGKGRLPKLPSASANVSATPAPSAASSAPPPPKPKASAEVKPKPVESAKAKPPADPIPGQ